MGNKYYIKAWGKHNDPWANDHGYSDKEMWGGQSLIVALFMLFKTKCKGYGCVTLECR